MYAIIEDSGTQIKVGKDDVIRVDVRDLDEGVETIEFDRVLAVVGGKKPKIGAPYVKGAKVTAQLMGEERSDKVIVQKCKRRKGYRRRKGHRQNLLRVKITDIKS